MTILSYTHTVNRSISLLSSSMTQRKNSSNINHKQLFLRKKHYLSLVRAFTLVPSSLYSFISALNSSLTLCVGRCWLLLFALLCCCSQFDCNPSANQHYSLPLFFPYSPLHTAPHDSHSRTHAPFLDLFFAAPFTPLRYSSTLQRHQ